MPVQKLVTKALQHYWRMTRSVTLGAQAVVLGPENKVLLIRHTYRPGWHFPGGGVEKGELAVTAMVRELREEAGVHVGEDEAELFGLYANFELFPSDHIALFVVRRWQQPQVPPPNHEIAEQGFFAREALPPDTNLPTLRRISEILGGTTPSRVW
jgi:8-oxo-dGTP pyrophosphatase MutT (NUDIX family)